MNRLSRQSSQRNFPQQSTDRITLFGLQHQCGGNIGRARTATTGGRRKNMTVQMLQRPEKRSPAIPAVADSTGIHRLFQSLRLTPTARGRLEMPDSIGRDTSRHRMVTSHQPSGKSQPSATGGKLIRQRRQGLHVHQQLTVGSVRVSSPQDLRKRRLYNGIGVRSLTTHQNLGFRWLPASFADCQSPRQRLRWLARNRLQGQADLQGVLKQQHCRTFWILLGVFVAANAAKETEYAE